MDILLVSQTQDKDAASIPSKVKFLFAGISGVTGTLLVHPADVLKTRLQVSGVGGSQKEYSGTFDVIRQIYAKEGPKGFYRGFGAALLRQCTYTSTRLGVYSSLADYYKTHYQSNPSVLASLIMGMCAGALGACAGAPAEVVLIRMAADGRAPAAERRNYKNLFDALVRIVREEGPLTLYRGNMPTMTRAVIVSMIQMSSYSHFKLFLQTGPLHMQPGTLNEISASVMAGCLTSFTSSPVDIVKTRLQNMKVTDGVPEYKGTFDCLRKIVKREGVRALWKGFPPYLIRSGGHGVIMFNIMETLSKLYNKHVLGIEGKGSSM